MRLHRETAGAGAPRGVLAASSPAQLPSTPLGLTELDRRGFRLDEGSQGGGQTLNGRRSRANPDGGRRAFAEDASSAEVAQRLPGECAFDAELAPGRTPPPLNCGRRGRCPCRSGATGCSQRLRTNRPRDWRAQLTSRFELEVRGARPVAECSGQSATALGLFGHCDVRPVQRRAGVTPTARPASVGRRARRE